MFMTREQSRQTGCHHPAKRAVQPSLRAVTRAWAQGESGFLRFGHNRVPLLHGEPASADTLQAIVYALYAEDTPSFTPSPVPGKPIPPKLATELWAAALSLSDRATLKGRARCRIGADVNFDRLNAFPIDRLTARFLGKCRDSKVRLGDSVRFDKHERMGILDDLVALEVLGVVKLQAPKQRPIQGAPQAAQEPRVQVDVGTERRLRREFEILADADAWTVLGCTPGMGSEKIDQAARRMASRYRQLSQDHRVSPGGQATAKRILARILEAAMEINSGTAKRSPARQLNPHTAFEEGLAQIDAGAYDNALKCFALAQKEQPHSARLQAWLGYALYHDFSRDLSRQRQGVRMIKKALDMGHGNGDPAYLMAKILHGDGELVRAWNYLDKVLKKHPAHKRAAALRDQVQKEIRRT